MNGYYETDEHVNWRWERRCKIAEEIIEQKEQEQVKVTTSAADPREG